MAMTRSQFLTLMVPGLRKVFFEQYKESELVYPRIYNVTKSSKRKESDQAIVGLDMMDTKAEGENLNYEAMAEGYSQDYIHTSYAKGVRITRELLDDELYNVIKRRIKSLARSARYRKEYDHALLFNNAGNTTYYTGGDDLGLLSTSHTQAGVAGGTWSNTPGSSDLSQSTLETGIVAFRSLTDDRGLLINIEPKYLLVPPALEPDAYELLRSTGKPGTADNDTNYLKGRLEIISWPFLTDTDSWFILADPSEIENPVSFNRVPVEFDSDGDFDSKDLKTSAYMRYSLGFIDPRFVYGSMGG